MLFFLRKIRRKLLSGNRITSYLLYAMGEIFLVVVGILIAVQIDGWKTASENRSLEKKVLNEIKNNLKSDLVEIQSDLEGMKVINASCEFLSAFLISHDKPDHDFCKNAGILRVTPHFDPNKSGYQLLVSKGLALIKNDSLRNAISIHYERLYTYYGRYEEERLRFHSLHSEPVLLRYFKGKFDFDYEYQLIFSISDKDYTAIKNDEGFDKLLSAIAMENALTMNRGQRVEASINNLIAFIENELLNNLN